MAVLDLQNPAGLYTAGVVDLNPLPYMQMAERARARKEARQQAVDQYYQKLPETINEKGVRDQEIPVINEAKNQLQKYWIENKDAIRKGNTPEAYNYGKMIRDVGGVAQESKNRTATAVKLAQLRGNPKYDYIFRDPKLIEKIAKHEATIGTPESEGIVFDQLTLPPAPFDRSKYINSIKIKPNPTEPVYKEIPGDKFKQLEVTGKAFSPEDLNALHITAQTEFENNPSFEKEIKENIQGNPEKAALMADIFQKNYGRPIKTEEDLAAAYTLSLMDLTSTQRIVPSGQAAFDYKRKAGMEDWDIKNRRTYAQSLEKIRQNRAAGQVPDGLGYVSDEVVAEYGVPLQSGKTFVDITNVDPERIDIITNRDLSKKKIGVQPVEINMTQPDGSLKRMKGYYVDPSTGDWEGKGGQKVSREAAKDRYIQSKAGTRFKAESGTKGSENTKPKKYKFD